MKPYRYQSASTVGEIDPLLFACGAMWRLWIHVLLLLLGDACCCWALVLLCDDELSILRNSSSTTLLKLFDEVLLIEICSSLGAAVVVFKKIDELFTNEVRALLIFVSLFTVALLLSVFVFMSVFGDNSGDSGNEELPKFPLRMNMLL